MYSMTYKQTDHKCDELSQFKHPFCANKLIGWEILVNLRFLSDMRLIDATYITAICPLIRQSQQN